MSATLVPAATLTGLFNLTDRRIRQLAAHGIIPKAERGRYDLAGGIKGYIGYLQGAIEGDPAHDDRARLIKARADKTETEAAALRAKYMPNEEVRDVTLTISATFASMLSGIHGRLAMDLAGESNPAVVRKILFDEVMRVRRETADKLRAYADSREPPPDANGKHRAVA